MYVEGFFVDNAEISKILSVNCGLYPFGNGILIFAVVSSIPSFEFWFIIFHEPPYFSHLSEFFLKIDFYDSSM